MRMSICSSVCTLHISACGIIKLGKTRYVKYIHLIQFVKIVHERLLKPSVTPPDAGTHLISCYVALYTYKSTWQPALTSESLNHFDQMSEKKPTTSGWIKISFVYIWTKKKVQLTALEFGQWRYCYMRHPLPRKNTYFVSIFHSVIFTLLCNRSTFMYLSVTSMGYWLQKTIVLKNKNILRERRAARVLQIEYACQKVYVFQISRSATIEHRRDILTASGGSPHRIKKYVYFKLISLKKICNNRMLCCSKIVESRETYREREDVHFSGIIKDVHCK